MSMTLGEKIQKLRKQNGFSQEELAEKVTVTRQTISKWELNQSEPDLDFIAQLSNIFNVSADYLIKKELTKPDELPFRKKRYQYYFSERSKRTMLVAISIVALIASVVCLICDYFTSDKLSWSFIAIEAIIAVWLVFLPYMLFKEKVIFRTLIICSIIPIPFLAILALLLKVTTIFTLGSCVSVLCIAVMWAIYGIFRKYHQRIFLSLGFSLLLLIFVPIVIVRVTDYFLPQYKIVSKSDAFNGIITFAIALICFGIDYLTQHKKENFK